MPRFFVDQPLSGQQLDLPAAAARHVQVLRLQPGDQITLFNGLGGQWQARIEQMGRSQVRVQILSFEDLEREPVRRVHLALGMPANERMDWLIEKAAELGATSIWPLHTHHSVLRLSGERASKKQLHWQAVAIAACEQCGGNRVPRIEPVSELMAWLERPPSRGLKGVLSLAADARPLTSWLGSGGPDEELLFLSGPEGGLAEKEEAAARAAGFTPVSLGPRVLRAETAALAALALSVMQRPT